MKNYNDIDVLYILLYRRLHNTILIIILNIYIEYVYYYVYRFNNNILRPLNFSPIYPNVY